MPKRKHREGQTLSDWEARKDQRSAAVDNAHTRVNAITKHVLLKPIEAAAMLGVTRKTLREMEARGELPLRVTFSSKIFGWRLGDLEACVDARMGFVLAGGAS